MCGGAATAAAAADEAAAAARQATLRSPMPRQRHEADAAAEVRQKPAWERRRQYGDEEELRHFHKLSNLNETVIFQNPPHMYRQGEWSALTGP